VKKQQATMSRAELLLQCSYPWEREVDEEEVSEPARFGSAYHAVMAAHLTGSTQWRAICSQQARKFDVDDEELKDHFARTAPVLVKWLKQNPYEIDFAARDLEVETSLALQSSTSARRCDPPDERHIYKAASNELPGTLDLVSYDKKGRKHLLVLDHKTGADVGDPVKAPQLLSQGAAAVGVYSASGDVLVGFFHAPRGGPGTVYVDNVSRAALADHGEKIVSALARIGDGTLKPGPWCGYCRMLTTCPAHVNSLAPLKRNGELTRERVGAIHQALNQYDTLAKKLREEVRAWVRANGEVTRPDGKTVGFESRPFTELSMKSIKEKLGEVEGAKLIAKLDKLGVIRHGERLELRASVE